MSLKHIIQKAVGAYLNISAYIAPKHTARLGFDLFCRPFSKKLKPHQKKYLEDAKYMELNHAGKKIQTYKWGNGSKNVLLIHGWASHSYRWKSYIEDLKQGDFTIYAIDAPGHGLSEGKYLTLIIYSELIADLISKIGKIDAIIGHSLGGYATILYLNQKNENSQVKSVIMGAPGEVSDFFEFYQKMLGLNQKTISLVNQEFLDRIGKNPSAFSAPLLAKNLTNPSFIIHDRFDKDTDFNYSVKLNAAWLDSVLKITEGLGHGLKSKSIEKEVINFISQN